MAFKGKYAIPPEAVEKLETVTSVFAMLCESAIFFLAGVVSARPLFAINLKQFGFLIWLYVIIHIVRGLVIFLFSPFLMRWGYKLQAKEMAVMWFGGLRGAVGLALALDLEAEGQEYGSEERRGEALLYVSGIVILTLLINGTFINDFYAYLAPISSPRA